MAARPSSDLFIAPVHGGPDALGIPAHDFSSNGNGCGPCPVALDALRAADASHYPDPQYSALRQTLAGFHQVDPARIVVAASASEFILRISAAFAQRGGRYAVLPTHSYGDYRRAARAWGLTAVAQPASAPAGLSDAALHWCCDPSSPLGQAEPGLAERIERLRPRDVAVLDLAYEPLRLQLEGGLAAERRDRVWQLWTPNKALGLTGLRCAYAIAPALERDLAAALAALAPSWPIGAHGVALLTSWTTPAAQHWLAGTRELLSAWKAQQLALCRSWGWTCLPSIANFFCARPAPHAVPPLVAALRGQGVKVRDAASFGLPDAVRLAVLSPSSQAALGQALHAATQAKAA